MPEARQNNSKLAEMFVSASSFSALVGIAVDVVSLFMALLSFVELDTPSLPAQGEQRRPPISTSRGTSAQSVRQQLRAAAAEKTGKKRTARGQAASAQ